MAVCPTCGQGGRNGKGCPESWHFRAGDPRLDNFTGGTMTDKRNTHVVLELGGRDVEEVIGLLSDASKNVEEGSDFFAWVAAEVKRQCPPVLEIGWHEVRRTGARNPWHLSSRYWDGVEWRTFAPLAACHVDLRDAWTSVRFLAGPAYPDFD
jgi:hypothetical protein